jgi:hypothetical protein
MAETKMVVRADTNQGGNNNDGGSCRHEPWRKFVETRTIAKD